MSWPTGLAPSAQPRGTARTARFKTVEYRTGTVGAFLSAQIGENAMMTPEQQSKHPGKQRDGDSVVRELKLLGEQDAIEFLRS